MNARKVHELHPIDACRLAIAGGWDVADASIYEDDLSLQDRIQLAAANDSSAVILPFPKEKAPA